MQTLTANWTTAIRLFIRCGLIMIRSQSAASATHSRMQARNADKVVMLGHALCTGADAAQGRMRQNPFLVQTKLSDKFVSS
jgi:hypothetical protein